MNFKELQNKLHLKHTLIGRERYKITGVLLPLFTVKNDCHLMFNIRSPYIPQPGEVCFPGGKFDPHLDKNTKETAIRETTEELGIEKDKIEYVGAMGHYVAPMGVLVDAHIAKIHISSLEDFTVNAHEVDAVFSISLKELKNMVPEKYNVTVKVDPYQQVDGRKELLLPHEKLGIPKRYDNPWGNIRHRIFVYQHEPVIWGITAELLHEFLKIV